MTLRLIPVLGENPNVPDAQRPEDVARRMQDFARTAKLLGDHGLSLEPDAEDQTIISTVATAYARDPEFTSEKMPDRRMANMTPASLVHADSILQEFGRSVVESSTQVRYLVTNKLLLLTENPDPRVQLKALEMLGKISDVGLFSDRREVTVTHQSAEEVRARLKEKLTKLVNPEEDVEEAVLVDNSEIDVDAELGLKSEVDEGLEDEVYEAIDDTVFDDD